MNKIILSGGDLGGSEVEWPEGQDELILDGFIYRKVSETQAVFVGLT